MAYDIPKFLKRKDDSLLFALEDKEFVFIVPEKFFERRDAIIIGEYVNLIGILDYAIFDKSGKHGGLKRFNFPSVFLTKPYEIEKMKQVKLTANSEIQDYRFLKYKKDDIIVVSTKVPEEIENVEEFYKIFLTGNLPTTIPYDKLQDYFTESARINGCNYGVSLQLFGIIISEMCRDPKNMNNPYRLAKNKNMFDYKAINIEDIPKLVSPYQSLTSVNWDEGLINAIINKNEVDSPLEKVLVD